MSLTATITKHVLGSDFTDLGPQVVSVTKQSLLDAIGVTFAASTLGDVTDAFVEIAREGGTSGPSTVIGYGFKTSPALAAFANGAMAHALDFEDTFDPALVHPNAAVVPAALAVAEALGNVSGKDLITAIAVGSDLTCRLGLAVEEEVRQGWALRLMLGAFGATAAVGRLLKLSEGQLSHAFSLTACQAAYSSGFMVYPPSHFRAVRDAFGAKAGVIAAQLARRGVRGFELPFEGPHGLYALHSGGRCNEAALTDSLGKVFQGINVSFKPWPSCRGTHAFIESALWLAETHRIAPEKIEHIGAIVSPFFRGLCEPPEQKRRPDTAIGAKFSIPFTVATALLRRRVGLDDFGPASRESSDVLTVASKMTHSVEERWSVREATRGSLYLRTFDGQEVSKEIINPQGHPDHPMTAAAIRTKFMDCVAHAREPVTPAHAAEIISAIDELEHHRRISLLAPETSSLSPGRAAS